MMEATDKVMYRGITGFDGYRFGDDGSVWSQWHWVRTRSAFGHRKVKGSWRRIGKQNEHGIARVLLPKRVGKVSVGKVTLFVRPDFDVRAADGKKIIMKEEIG